MIAEWIVVCAVILCKKFLIHIGEGIVAVKLKSQDTKSNPSSTSGGEIGLKPVDLITVRSIEEVTAISEAVRKAIYSGSHCELNHPHRSTPSPKSNDRVKPKSVKTAKPTKAKQSKKKRVAKPLHRASPVTDDSEQYAIWWDYNTDLTKGEYPSWRGQKVIPFPVNPKDKVDCIRKSRNSEARKAQYKQLQAVGITPETEKKRPNLLGNAPHPSDPSFKAVLESNKKYERELIDRTVTQSQIEKVIPLYWVHGKVKAEVGEYPEAYVDNSKLINVIEAQLADSNNDLETLRRNDTAERKALDQVFDLPDQPTTLESLGLGFSMLKPASGDTVRMVGPVMQRPSANDEEPIVDISDWAEAEAHYEKEQWPMEDTLTAEQCLEQMKHMPLVGNEEAAYYLALQKYDRDGPTSGLIDYSDTGINYIAEGADYLQWLIKASTNSHRSASEYALLRVDKHHNLEMGYDVHPLEQCNPPAFEHYKRCAEARREAAMQYGITNTLNYGQWLRIATQSKPVIDADTVEKRIEIRESLSEKLVEQAKASQDTVVEEESTEQQEDTTTISADSPTPEGKGAEVVYLKEVKSERKEGVSELMQQLKVDVSKLSKDERKALVAELMNQM